jgi:hypothetical protein
MQKRLTIKSKVTKGFHLIVGDIWLNFGLNDDGIDWFLTMLHKHILKDNNNIYNLIDTIIDDTQYETLIHYLVKYAINYSSTTFATSINKHLTKLTSIMYNNSEEVR